MVRENADADSGRTNRPERLQDTAVINLQQSDDVRGARFARTFRLMRGLRPGQEAAGAAGDPIGDEAEPFVHGLV